MVASDVGLRSRNTWLTDPGTAAESRRGWPAVVAADSDGYRDVGAPCRAGTAALHNQAVGRVIDAMYARLPGALSLGELGEIAHLSPFHLCRVFRQLTGSPPGEFLAALRVQEAKRLLLTTGLSVTDVCFELGYRSLGTFTSRFTHAVGVSPGRLRRHADAAAEQLDRLRGGVPACVSARQRIGRSRGVVSGCVTAADVDSALIFVGLFPTAIPQGRPVAGTVLAAPGGYRIPAVNDGCYHVLAAALPPSDHTLAYLLPHDGTRVGVGSEPVLVRGGVVFGRGDLALRPITPADPPVVVALPFLLA